MRTAALLAALVPAAAAAAEPGAWWQPGHAEIFGSVEVEGTGFLEDAAFPRQARHGGSVAVETTVLLEWDGGATVATLTPFWRLDAADDARSHFDIREMKLDHTRGAWSVTLGVDRVFWGRTEVVHLVDIVNQTDAVESLDDEDRLGQPMLRVARLFEIGEVALFYLPYARERTLPGPEGRLRLPVPYAGRGAFETAAGQWTPSFAARYAGSFGGLDLGLSAFHGVSRDPAFRAEAGRLVPVYSRIGQAGVDAQYTAGATLWKGEAILREGQRNARFATETYGAATAGLEHTLYGVFDTGADLGLILEGAWDSRGEAALTAFERDAIAGLRLTLNDTADTAVLLTGSADLVSGAAGLRLEAERRLGPRVTAELEAQGFLNAAGDAAGRGFADDRFVRLKIRYFF